ACSSSAAAPGRRPFGGSPNRAACRPRRPPIDLARADQERAALADVTRQLQNAATLPGCRVGPPSGKARLLASLRHHPYQVILHGCLVHAVLATWLGQPCSRN